MHCRGRLQTFTEHRPPLPPSFLWLCSTGFINCDHPTRKPNDVTVEGMHTIFTNKKQMKKAQDENPLAGRGFKKQVVSHATASALIPFKNEQRARTACRTCVCMLLLYIWIRAYIYIFIYIYLFIYAYLCVCVCLWRGCWVFTTFVADDSL